MLYPLSKLSPFFRRGLSLPRLNIFQQYLGSRRWFAGRPNGGFLCGVFGWNHSLPCSNSEVIAPPTRETCEQWTIPWFFGVFLHLGDSINRGIYSKFLSITRTLEPEIRTRILFIVTIIPWRCFFVFKVVFLFHYSSIALCFLFGSIFF